MILDIEKMTALVFSEYKNIAIKLHAIEQSEAQDQSKESSEASTLSAFNRLLPDGINTKDHFFYSIKIHTTKSIAGYIWTYHHETATGMEAYLYDILILEEYKRMGIGKKSLGQILENLKLAGFRRVVLHAFSRNQAAINLYRSLGFRETSIYMAKNLK
ncbi:putative N-acetyltransferase YycN [compost metagenome]